MTGDERDEPSVPRSSKSSEGSSAREETNARSDEPRASDGGETAAANTSILPTPSAGRVGRPGWLVITDGEIVLWSSRKSRWFLGSTFFMMIVALVGASSVAVTPDAVFEPLTSTTGVEVAFLRLVAIGMFALMGLASLVDYLRWRSEWYVVTTNEIYRKSGLISTNTTQIRYDDIRNTKTETGILGRIFHHGNIHIDTSGTDSTELSLASIPRPSRVNEIITRRRDEVDNG